jgi:serine/threonine protein kinase
MITDFGLSRASDTKDDNGADPVVGIIAYIAPERLSNPGLSYTASMDIYSLAWIFWEISSGHRPFNARNDVSLAFEIILQELREEMDPSVPPPYAELVKECWHVEPTKRPALNDIKKRLRVMMDTKLATPKLESREIGQEEEDEEPVVLQLDSTYVTGLQDFEEDEEVVSLQLDSAYVTGLNF